MVKTKAKANRYVVDWGYGELCGPYTKTEMIGTISEDIGNGENHKEIKVYLLGPRVPVKVTPAKVEIESG